MKTNETIYETYSRVICPECENKDKDLCNITSTIDNKAKCINYLRCNRCIHKKEKACIVTAKKGKPLMKGICQ